GTGEYVQVLQSNGKYGVGPSISTTSVKSSVASTPSSLKSIGSSSASIALPFLIGCIAGRYRLSVSGSSTRFHDYSKSCAVIGSPFDHWRLSRRWNVNWVASSLTSQLSAHRGTTSPVGISIPVKPSKILKKMSNSS